MDDLIGLAVMLSLPGYLVLQWYATWKADGRRAGTLLARQAFRLPTHKQRESGRFPLPTTY